MIHITTPMDETTRLSLRTGDEVLISGTIYTGRDAAHKRMVQSIEHQEPLPFSLKDQIIYYVGPTPARPGQPIGSCGPTSSYRMDPYSIQLMPKGLKIMIGKGDRGDAFKQALIQEKAVYLIAIGGIGALLSKRVTQAKLISYPDLLSEAVYELTVEDFPAIVAYDSIGGDIFQRKD